MPAPSGEDVNERIRKLNEQLRAQPDDQAARLALIEAYTEAGRVDEFLREAATYKSVEKRLAARQKLGATPIPPASDLPATEKPAMEKLAIEAPPGFFDHGGTSGPRKRFGTDESAKAPLAELAREYAGLRGNAAYLAGLDRELALLAGRPTPMLYARRLSEHAGGARIFLKQENTGRVDPHLSIAVTGQMYLAKALGRPKVYAAPRDLHWGARMAAACAHFGLEAHLYVDESLRDTRASLVFQMQLMGAKVSEVRVTRYPHGDIREAALEAWLQRPKEGFLFMGLDSGPDPYPQIARDLTAVIGREVRSQIVAEAGRGPDVVLCRGGENADALGLMPAFLDDDPVRRYCVSPAPVEDQRDHNKENPFFVADTGMTRARAQAILEGLEYESVAREQGLLKASGRIEYVNVDFNPARDALRNVARLEGVAVGLQTAHVLAHACTVAASLPREAVVAVLLAERPDKDLWDVAKLESLGV